MVRLVDNIATLYLPIPSKNARSRTTHQSLIQTLSSRQRVIPQNSNLPNYTHQPTPRLVPALIIEMLSTKNNIDNNKNDNDGIVNGNIKYMEIPEHLATSKGVQVHKKILSSIKPLSTPTSITTVDTTVLYTNLINNDTKLSIYPQTTSSNPTLSERKEEEEGGGKDEKMFRFDNIFPLSTEQNLFSSSALLANIPEHTLSAPQLQNLPTLPSQTRLLSPHFNLKLTSTHPNARKPTNPTMCSAIISQSKSPHFTFEIPSVISPKFAIQKMNFSDVQSQALPKIDESHAKLFSKPHQNASPFYNDMLLRAYKVTSHVPSCLLFQPMKIPAVSHAKMRSFDLFRSLGIEFLEENNDHQLFNIFLEPYLNSDRMFALKKRMLSLPTSPKTIKVRRMNEKPSSLSLMCILPLRRQLEQCEDSSPLAMAAELPLPKVSDVAFSVDDSLSEFMKIRGKDVHKGESVSTTPLRKKKRVVEEKSFFDVGCLLVLSEHFPLFPVVNRFLERYRNDNVLWIFNELNTYERFLISLFSRIEALSTISTAALTSRRSINDGRDGTSNTLFHKKFSLVIGGLDELKGVVSSTEFKPLFQGSLQQNTHPKFLTICYKSPPAVFEHVDFVSKELNTSYAMGNSSEKSLSSILHQKISRVKVPSSISKEVTPFLGSPKHSLFVKSLVLQDFDTALSISSTRFPSLRRCVEILRLEFEAGLFANDAAQAFSEDVLPAMSNALASPESLVAVVSNDVAELNFVFGFIPEEKVVIVSSASKLPKKEIFERVGCVFRFEYNWAIRNYESTHDGGCSSIDNDETPRKYNGGCDWNSKIIEEFLFYHLVHAREKPACFFVLEFSLDGRTSHPTVFDWWNAQDAQRVIYTSSLPEKSAFFYPISQIKKVSLSNETCPKKENVRRKRRPKRIVLSISRATLAKHSELLQSTDEYVFVIRFKSLNEGKNGNEDDNCCFVQTGFFSGVFVVFSAEGESEQKYMEYVRSVIREKALVDVVVLVWYEFTGVRSFRGLAEKCRTMYFKNEASFKSALGFAIGTQTTQSPNENSWVLEDETPNERFLSSLGLSSFVAQFLLASLSLGKILTMPPSELCHRVGLPPLMNLMFFRIVRCIFEGGPHTVKIPVTPKKRGLNTATDANPEVIGRGEIQSTPSKMTKIVYELPRGNVLGQTKLKALDYNGLNRSSREFHTNRFGKVELGRNGFNKFAPNESDLNDFELGGNEFDGYPKCKTPRLTAASSPIKSGLKRPNMRSKKEICDFISNMYMYNGDNNDGNHFNGFDDGNGNIDEKYEKSNRMNEDNNNWDGMDGNRMKFKRNPNSPRKTVNSPFAPKNARLTIPKFETMRKFPRITFKK